MIFTQEQIEEIRERLLLSGTKDTQLPAVNLPLLGNENITLVQDGENKKVPIDTFYNEFGRRMSDTSRTDIFNVSKYAQSAQGSTETIALTLEEAIDMCPNDIRKPGQIITFLNSNTNKWETWQYTASVNTNWSTTSYWSLESNAIINNTPGAKSISISYVIDTRDAKNNSNESLPSIDALYGPYNSKQAAWTALSTPNSSGETALVKGKTVGVIEEGSVVEYWFESACNSIDDLVKKNTTTVDTVEDDLTMSDGVLRLADRSSEAGMGYIILRTDKTFAEQVTEANTIYEIRYDYDLNNTSITMPSNCMLNFNGGSINNGTLVCNGLSISKKSGTAVYTGKYNFANIMYAEDYFNESNAQGLAALQAVIDMKPFNSEETTVIYFASGRLYDWTGTLNLNKKNITLTGGGTIKGTIRLGVSKQVYEDENLSQYINSQFNIHINNLRFDKGLTTVEEVAEAEMTDANSSFLIKNCPNVIISNCTFHNVPYPIIMEGNDGEYVNQNVRRFYITHCSFDRCRIALLAKRTVEQNTFNFGDTTFANNNVYPTEYGVKLSNVDGFVCVGNTFYSCSENDIYLDNVYECIISHNELFGTYCKNVIKVIRSSQLIIMGNMFGTFKPNYKAMDGIEANLGFIYFADSCFSYDVKINNNTFNAGYGIPIVIGRDIDIRRFVANGNSFYNEPLRLCNGLPYVYFHTLPSDFQCDFIHRHYNGYNFVTNPLLIVYNEWDDIINYFSRVHENIVYDGVNNKYTIQSITDDHATTIISPVLSFTAAESFKYEFFFDGKYYEIDIAQDDTGDDVIDSIATAIGNKTGFTIDKIGGSLYLQCNEVGRLLLTPFIILTTSVSGVSITPIRATQFSLGKKIDYKDKDGYNFLRPSEKNNPTGGYYLSDDDLGRIICSADSKNVYAISYAEELTHTEVSLSLNIPDGVLSSSYICSMVCNQFAIYIDLNGKQKSDIISEITDVLETFYPDISIDSEGVITIPEKFLNQPIVINTIITVASPSIYTAMSRRCKLLQHLTSGAMISGITSQRPDSPIKGDIYVDTQRHYAVRFDGTDWIPMDGYSVDGLRAGNQSEMQALTPRSNWDYGMPFFALSGSAQNKPCYWNGSAWVTADGEIYNIARSGNTANKPTPSKIGFVYMDNQIGVPCYWNGSVWIAADGEQSDIARSGTTTNRPTPSKAGFCYYDTTLGKPIWWNGTNWIDATGTNVNASST